MPATATRARLVEAAFRLFADQGFEQTTVDAIAAEAGVSRTTFFRSFASKEAVVFPDHAPILAAVDARLASASRATADIALVEASRIVLDTYLAEGEVARARYALTTTVPALRAAEIANQRSYQQLFRDHLRRWLGVGDRDDDLLAELLANAVTTAHNHVLRRWLRGQSEDPTAELNDAVALATRSLRSGEDTETQVVVLRSGRSFEDVLPEVRRLLDQP
ncbi:TetR family transcriptional regulator [Nocardioides sp. GY 10113]|uniref:TetR/AcrR family transcriptional regulator n=1 Tax=Nocardioides sp. GY 10113 TaxID=2569761 RepID=UPI0010A81C24|nr:TetR/AcrR family transcriptional regulator [Nocardioides sp. GY 10113]TIC86717.1 TetR family transcriptional regulator [Nocardioides sp. GY 10113]